MTDPGYLAELAPGFAPRALSDFARLLARLFE